jgi:hypothetical protein
MMCAARLRLAEVDERGQRGRLARPGRPGDQHEAAGQVGEVRHLLGDAEVLQRQDLEGDHPHHRADGVALLEDVDAEAGDPRIE